MADMSSASAGVLTQILQQDTKTLLETQQYAIANWTDPMRAALTQVSIFFGVLARVPDMRFQPMVMVLIVGIAQSEFVEAHSRICFMMRDTFLALAERGTSAPGFANIMNPSQFFSQGLAAIDIIVKNSTVEALEIFGTGAAIGLATILEMSYLMMTWGAMLAVEQWYITLLTVAVLIPFLLAPPLRFLADQAARIFVGSTVWLFSCAAVGAKVLPAINASALGTDQPVHDILVIVGQVGWQAFCMACLPAILGVAAGYGSGDKVLSTAIALIGSALSAGAGLVAAAAGGGAGAGAASRSVVGPSGKPIYSPGMGGGGGSSTPMSYGSSDQPSRGKTVVAAGEKGPRNIPPMGGRVVTGPGSAPIHNGGGGGGLTPSAGEGGGQQDAQPSRGKQIIWNHNRDR